jgi:hypothetical protein
MQGEADGGNLTAAAVALLDAVAAGLSGEARFKALMAVAALRMAERERALAGRLAAAEAAVLSAAGAAGPEQACAALRRPEARLSAALHKALLEDAIMRTAVTKPGALTAGERTAAGL